MQYARGYAIALHGDMVVHRAAPLVKLKERISMVNGYVALDTTVDEQSRTADLIIVDDHGAADDAHRRLRVLAAPRT